MIFCIEKNVSMIMTLAIPHYTFIHSINKKLSIFSLMFVFWTSLLSPCRMWPDDEHSWKHAVRSDNSHQPVWSEPKGEWRTHSVTAQPVPVTVWVCAEQHVCFSEHGEDWWPAGQPAGVRQQFNSFILTGSQNFSLISEIVVKCSQNIQYIEHYTHLRICE